MSESRPTPFDLVFAGLAEERFDAVRGAVEAAGCHAQDRDAFTGTDLDAATATRALRGSVDPAAAADAM